MESKKTIRVKYLGFYPSFDPEQYLVTRILRKYFDLQLVDKDPEFLICNHFDPPFQYVNYSCPRVFITGENFSPDFNCFDYTITFDPLQYNDRHFYAPYFLLDPCTRNYFLSPGAQDRQPKEELLAQKDLFCDFIFTHDSVTDIRRRLFEKLSSYRRVESAGPFMNNMPGGYTVPYSEDGVEKMKLIRRCKFSVVSESVVLNGFISEKVTHAWMAHSIPIFYGNPQATQILNPKAILNVHDYENLDDLLAEIVRLDQDPDAWYEKVCQPLFLEPDYFVRRNREFEEFLVHIFSQDPQDAYRRTLHFSPEEHEAHLRCYNHFLQSRALKTFRRERRFKQRCYWARYHLHRLFPNLVHAPDDSLLRW